MYREPIKHSNQKEENENSTVSETKRQAKTDPRIVIMPGLEGAKI